MAAFFGRQSPQHAEEGSKAIELAVEGMTCKNCVAKLESTLRSDVNVDSAHVSLSDEQLQVYGEVSEARVRELVELAGFVPK